MGLDDNHRVVQACIVSPTIPLSFLAFRMLYCHQQTIPVVIVWSSGWKDVLLIKGLVDSPYICIAAGSPWVAPSSL